ncbi:MAG: glycine/sarcosine/betaine reductase component B subunit [Deltaproteobacteria bacterium]|jgi:hypothetical protein|nr:glycine/sarcosine/betaine reductase component B subunit [Deltaproteobacteria bacterium]
MGTGPSTKETTLHHYRDPLVDLLTRDKEVDFPGIIIAGTSDEQEHKAFVASRIGALLESMRADGVIVSIDSWGNCHIDFTAVIENIGERGIPLVGVSFVGTQAAFVVSNSYMTNSIIDLNKTSVGDETCVMGQNTASGLDALKALAVLKNKIKKKYPEKNFQVKEEKRLRRLILRSYAVNRVEEAGRTGLNGNTLLLDPQGLVAAALSGLGKDFPQVKDVQVKIIRPDERKVFVNSILDFSPVAAKAAGRPGEGISHALAGAQVMLTAVEENGFQPANIGSAHGRLDEHVVFGLCGTPAQDDYIIHIDVLLKEGGGRTREGIMAAHQACDLIVHKIRQDLRGLPKNLAAASRELWDTVTQGGCKIALVKIVSGLGCLYDTALFPDEPGGYIGSKSIMDSCNNVQVVLSANEHRDGVIRSLS